MIVIIVYAVVFLGNASGAVGIETSSLAWQELAPLYHTSGSSTLSTSLMHTILEHRTDICEHHVFIRRR